MSDLAIEARAVGKRYTIIGGDGSYKTLRESIVESVSAPFRRKLQSGRKGSSAFWALRNVSFQIRQGEVVGIVGRNGAGKSTLLKILSRITDPTEGEVDINGRVGSLLEVGSGFHAELTGRENIYLNGSILGMKRSEIDTKFDEIIAFAETEKFLDTPVKFYSSGMYMRLSFAVAAHLEPEILLVDEVLAVGDASFQKKCLGKMGEVSREGRTVVFVSHNLTALKRLCNRALWLNEGNAVEIGEARKVIDHYLQKSMVSKLESLWPDNLVAPGDNRVRLRGVRVTPLADIEDPITVHTPLQIEFMYWNYFPGRVLNSSMLLYNLEEVCVLTSVSDFTPRPAGMIRDTVQIPGNFLNAGSYYVNIIIVQDAATGILRRDNVVAFDVIEGEVTGNWYGRSPGVVRPKLKWVSDTIEASDCTLPPAWDLGT
jgi:lipopolysaccharide transport system ATP-binding protein